MEEHKIIQEEIEVENKGNLKEKIKHKCLLASTIITGVVVLLLLCPFIYAFVTNAVWANDTIESTVRRLPFEDENSLTLSDKYRWYKRLNDHSKWNFGEFTEPVLVKMEEMITDYNDNYSITIKMPIDFVENRVKLSYKIDADVDGNIAHGFLENEFDIKEILEKNSEEENILYNNKIEFYRVLEGDKITTYVSKDGETWLSKEGVVLNQNHVLFDIKNKVSKIDAQNATWFPAQMASETVDGEEEERIFAAFHSPSGTNILTDGNFLYQDCDSWNEMNVILDANSYLPEMFAIMLSANVHEDKLQAYFEETNDPILNKICESEIRFAPVYVFRAEDYGKMDIELPDELKNAKPVDSFAELFTDLEPLLDEYAVKSEWR